MSKGRKRQRSQIPQQSKQAKQARKEVTLREVGRAAVEHLSACIVAGEALEQSEQVRSWAVSKGTDPKAIPLDPHTLAAIETMQAAHPPGMMAVMWQIIMVIGVLADTEQDAEEADKLRLRIDALYEQLYQHILNHPPQDFRPEIYLND